MATIVHNRVVIIWEASSLHKGMLQEVPSHATSDIVPLNSDVLVSIGPRLFM